MFKWLNKRDICSDDGFSFICDHRYYYKYVKGDRVLKICVEPLKNGLEVIFDVAPKWEAPYEEDVLSESEILEIENRVCRSFEFMGIKYSVKKR
jgi:hypothetical protein